MTDLTAFYTFKVISTDGTEKLVENRYRATEYALSLVKHSENQNNIRFEHKVNGEWQADSAVVDQFGAKVTAYQAQPTSEKKLAAQKASTLQTTLRQLAKVAELLSRTATIGQDEIAVLDSAIADVRTYLQPSAKPTKTK
jgi:hypothetical protein